jgi:DNA recombination protein RmuC
MEVVYLIVCLVLLLVIFGIGFILYKSRVALSELLKKQEELREDSRAFEIELAKYQQRLKELEKLEVKLESKDALLEERAKELVVLKEEVTYYKTSQEEQKVSMEEKLEILKQSEEKLKHEFENLANRIFEQKSQKFEEQNRTSLETILNPVKSQISEFKRKVEDVYDKEAKDRVMLKHELQSLKELNQKISQDAINLTNALKGENKTQGSWGEMVLERVLESSGLRKGHEYTQEVALLDGDGNRYRPDVVVHLPENRDIIVDSKSSLVAYNEYINSSDEVSKELHLKSHIRSIKEHIKSLSEKKYEDLEGVNSLDFIFMFVPIESALMLALDSDVGLYDAAFKEKIILVSPTTLLVALRAIENSWRYEKQAKSIADVAYRAEELYKKFNGFIEDLKKVGKSIEGANESYSEAFKKLSSGRGNLVSQVTMLQKVSNIKPKKELDSDLVQRASIGE